MCILSLTSNQSTSTCKISKNKTNYKCTSCKIQLTNIFNMIFITLIIFEVQQLILITINMDISII